MSISEPFSTDNQNDFYWVNDFMLVRHLALLTIAESLEF